MKKKSIYEIVSATGMSTRPEYYSGYEASSSDLGMHRLQDIHRGIKENFGEDAAKNFAKMVRDLKSLAACVFLQSLYNLSRNEWVWQDSPAPSNVAASPDSGQDPLVKGVALMAGFMTAQRTDPGASHAETMRMKNGFLRSINETVPDSDYFDEYAHHRLYTKHLMSGWGDKG